MILLLAYTTIANLVLSLIILFVLLWPVKATEPVIKTIKRLGDTYNTCEFCKKYLPDVTLSADNHMACSKCRKIVLAQ